MSYVLALYFEYKRYKKDAVIKIFADDHLVDELILKSDVKLKAFERLSPLEGFDLGTPGTYTDVQFIPKKIFLFEVSEHYLKNRIRIEVINNDNNYTNGFMSNYSWFKFHGMYLIPACALQSSNKSRLKNFFRDQDSWPSFLKPVISEHGTAQTKDFLDNFYFFKKGGSFKVEFLLSGRNKDQAVTVEKEMFSNCK